MFSPDIAIMIQKMIRNEMHISVSVFDHMGCLLCDSEESVTGNQKLDLNNETISDPRIIPFFEGNIVKGYVVCDEIPPAETASAIRMFTHAVLALNQKLPGVNMSMQVESLLAMRLLSDDAPMYRNDILSSAARLGYHLDHPMSVIVVHLETNYNYCLNIDLGYERATDDARQSVISALKQHAYMNKHDLISFVQNDNLVIFKAIEDMKDVRRLYQVQFRMMEAVDEILRPYQVFTYYIAAGRIAENFDKAYLSYKEAVDYINYAKTTSINHPIITWNDILDFSMTRSLPHGFYVDMIEPQVQEMLQQNQGMMDGLIQCFDSYINNGFSIASTARNAYLHRNTVMKRMRKLHKLTGFDPMGDFQSVLMNKLILQQYMLELEKGLVSS